MAAIFHLILNLNLWDVPFLVDGVMMYGDHLVRSRSDESLRTPGGATSMETADVTLWRCSLGLYMCLGHP